MFSGLSLSSDPTYTQRIHLEMRKFEVGGEEEALFVLHWGIGRNILPTRGRAKTMVGVRRRCKAEEWLFKRRG